MEERKYADLRIGVDQDDKLATEATIDGDTITPPENYLIGKITKVDNGMLVEFVKKQSPYPKTYEECCEIMQVARPIIWFDYNDVSSISKEGDEYERYIENTLCAFRELLICRDAYWKIAGEEMGLGKPWKPDKDKNNGVYYIFYCVTYSETRRTAGNLYANEIFSFPTKEMRDAFFENFKELIEICKELL